MAKKPTTKSTSRSRKVATAKTTPKSVAETKTSKQNAVLALLRRQNGASIAEIIEATAWQPHSVRGFISGALKKRLKIDVVSEKSAETGERRYFVAALKSWAGCPQTFGAEGHRAVLAAAGWPSTH